MHLKASKINWCLIYKEGFHARCRNSWSVLLEWESNNVDAVYMPWEKSSNHNLLMARKNRTWLSKNIKVLHVRKKNFNITSLKVLIQSAEKDIFNWSFEFSSNITISTFNWARVRFSRKKNRINVSIENFLLKARLKLF